MERYRQRTIAELLKKTYKLNRPRMTAILEGKDRMQGPLDTLDSGVDFAEIQVCGICRNHLDASIAQNCGVCMRGYHSFCLETPRQASQESNISCCYYCQNQAAPDSSQPGSTHKDSHNKLSDNDDVVIRRANENMQHCDEPGTSASEHSPGNKKRNLLWSETSPSKRSADSGGDTLYLPTKTRGKLCIRRKRIPDTFGQESSCSQALSSGTGTSSTVIESSGMDAVLTAVATPLVVGSGGVTTLFLKEDKEDAQDLDGPTLIQNNNPMEQTDSEMGNGEQPAEGHNISPKKNAEIAVEIGTGDKLIKEGDVIGAEKMMEIQKVDLAITQPASSASMPSEDCLTGCFGKASVMSDELPQKIQEELTDSVMEWQSSNGTEKVVAKMVSEHDFDGEIQVCLQQQAKSVDGLPMDEHSYSVGEKLTSNTSADGELFQKDAMEKGARSPMPAIEAAKNKSLCVVCKGGEAEDVKVVKGALSSTLEESDKLLTDGLRKKDEHLAEILPSSLKGFMEVDSIFMGSETAPAVSEDFANTRAVTEDVMKVCDTCGDAGFEDMITTCSDCNGAEHVYCYESLMAQVPEGYWQCNVCKSKQKTGDSPPSTDPRTVNSLPTKELSVHSTKKQYSTGNARSRLSALLQKRKTSDKKRPLKGVPSSQFTAKRGRMEDATDAPPAKKQAVENSSNMSNMPSSKFGLLREVSFKAAPETGKVKFVSPTALMGTNGEGSVLSSRGSGKSSHLAGSLSLVSIYPSTSQSGQASKGRLSSASSSIAGTVNKVNATIQLNNLSSGVPLASSGSKTPGALKSGESLPSFLLSSKSLNSKGQLISKGLKEASDSLPVNFIKEGVSGQAGTSNTRTLVKSSSFKLSKGIVTLEPKLKNDSSLDSARPPGPKILDPEAGVVKPADSKHEGSLTGGLAETACEVEATTEPCLHSEIHVGLDDSNKSSKQGRGGSLQVIRQSTKDEVSVASSCRSEAQISSALSSSGKDAQVLGLEQDITMKTQMISPRALVKQISRISEPDTSKEAPKISKDTFQSVPLLPLPVVGVQESPIGKTDEKRPLQLAVNVDTSGENNVVDKSPTPDDARSSFTPRSRSFGAWGTPSYVPSLGSTRCYRCKELGHSAKNCNSRSSMPCLPSEGAGALKPVPPFSTADNTGWSKGTPSTDTTTRNSLNAVEMSPRIKPVLEIIPVTKPPYAEGVSVSVQGLCSTVGEAQSQMQGGQVVDNVVPLLPTSSASHEQGMRKETMDPNKLQAAKPLQCPPTQVNVGGTDDIVKSKEIKVGNDVTVPGAANSTAVHVPNGPLLPRSAAECQPPLLPIPVALKNVAHFSASLGQPSSASLKATNPLVSRYQDSMKVYPEAQIVWQGTFEVAGRTQVSFHGLQANPSNRALPKVREVARKLQPLLPLEELPRGSEHNSWPVPFQKSPPVNDNIALYFFASGKESYVQYYKPLVDHLIKFDLTLKGFIEDAELLIFPSNLLPPGSQCWNNFMFLWAVFRARKLPVKQPILHMETSEPKPVGTEGSLKPPLQSGVLPWGKVEDTQLDTSGMKSIDTIQVSENKAETPGPTMVEGVNRVGPFILSDSEFAAFQKTASSQLEVQHLMEAEVVGKERMEQKAEIEPISNGQEKLAATVLPSTQSTISVVKSQPLSHPSFPEGGLITKAGNESSQTLADSDGKADEKVDATTKLVVSSAVKSSSGLLKTEQGSSEKAKHSTPVIAIPPASLASPSPRDRQEDLWTPRKLSSDKEKGVRERVHDKSDRVELGRGVSRDRDRDKQRDREKQKERDRDREQRSRRHSDYEREKERERVKERDRDKDRDRDRERDRDRGRDRDRDRERWRDREDRDRRGRDWDRDRDRDRVSERDKVREQRGRDRELERERILARERSSRHRHWDPDGDYGRSGRHWHRHPRSRTPSRSPPGNRDWSPSRARLERYHHRYRRSSRHSRSYSHSPDSDHGMGRLQTRAESRDLSKDSFVQKGKSPDIIAAKEESVVKNSTAKDEEQGNFSQRGSNSNSLCRETSAGAGRKLPIADLNLSPSEIEGCEADGLEDEVVMSVEVAKPLTANQDDLISNGHEYSLPNGGPGKASREPGECSISAGKVVSYGSTEHLGRLDERTDSLSHSLRNDSSGPSLFPVSMSIEGSSSCLQFFPQAPDEAPSAPDLNLALGGAKELSPPKQGELPFIMQLLEPSHHGSLRAGTFNSSLDVPVVSEPADLSLSLAIPEHSKRPIVNTSLRLFG